MMTAVNIRGEVDISNLPVDSEEFTWDNWSIKYKKSHILHSLCTAKCAETNQEPCLLCLYTKTLEIPHLPEMVFANNALLLTHYSGGQIELNALDALRCVSSKELSLKVACSEEWSETRSSEFLGKKVKPFDWTFTTNYKGTVTGPVKIIPTEERIDIEKLKEKEKILFYQEVMLYEDELHDHGISSCTIKIRVMPSSFFVLLRFFLRVDNVMVRINDTRIYHCFGTNYILREFTNKECDFNHLKLPLTDFGDPNVLSQHVPLKTSEFEKLLLDTGDSSEAQSTSQ